MAVLVFALAATFSLATAYPSHPSPRATSLFPAGISWDILLNTGGDTSSVEGVVDDNFQVIDIDLFDTSAQTIAGLKASKRVICYFSAGTREAWRSDASKFRNGDTGGAVGGGPNGDWPDEVWVDVTSANVRAIMRERIVKAAQAGCDAVDPDNVDGFDNDTGFNHPKSAYVEYVKFMAKVARENKLAIGLKNAVDMIPDVVGSVDFAVNEQCHEYRGECAKYKPFTDQNKAVFNIEYGGHACQSPAGVKLSTLIKSEDQALNELGGSCTGQEVGTPTEGRPPSSSVPQRPTASEPAPVDEGEGEDEEDGDGEEEVVPAPAPTRRPFGWGWWRGGHWN